jgi:HD-GYP domain-containing protein (c-di-GMP phosphodiesterase class II)
MSSYSEIPAGIIEMGIIPFDLHIQQNDGEIAIFAAAGSEINNEQRELLISDDKKFLVDNSQYDKYLGYVKERIEKLVVSQFVSDIDKADLFFKLGQELVESVHDNPLDRSIADNFARYIKAHIDLMMHSREASSRLLDLSSSAPYELSHSFNSCIFCMLIGQKIFGNNRKKLWELGMSGMLMDIGMFTISPKIRFKYEGLTAGERSVVQRHTLTSRRIIEHLNLDKNIYYVGFYHHERYDGSGYPSGLVGEEIPIYARIAAVADVYDAITSNRSYSEPSDHINALIEMYNQREKFDPVVLNALTEIVLKREKIVKAFKEKVLGEGR